MEKIKRKPTARERSQAWRDKQKKINPKGISRKGCKLFPIPETLAVWRQIEPEIRKNGRVTYSGLWSILETKTVVAVNACVYHELLMTDGRGGFVRGQNSVAALEKSEAFWDKWREKNKKRREAKNNGKVPILRA